jgi:Flp pilus assembly protein TadD
MTEYQDPIFLATLAAAYAENGRFAEATTQAKKALDLARSKGAAETVLLIENLLDNFRANRPYRTEPGTF